MGKTRIQWAGATWNPIRSRNKVTGKVGTWCQKISPGCAHCYAESHNHRNLPHGSSGLPYSAQGGEQVEIFIDPKILAEPLRRRKPETYFVCSMTDLFQAAHSFELIAAVWGVMAACPQHTFQVLTKRPERAREFLAWLQERVDSLLEVHKANRRPGTHWLFCDIVGAAEDRLGRSIIPQEDGETIEIPWPLPNVWLGCSAENQENADKRIPDLLDCAAAVRFVSIEPLLGSVDLHGFLEEQGYESNGPQGWVGTGRGLDWVIVGGESGHGARPCNIAWIRDIVKQCQEAGTACFVKQLGAKPYMPAAFHCRDEGSLPLKLKDKKGGDPSEWPEDLRVREMPEVPHA
jgi:protein gp37